MRQSSVLGGTILLLVRTASAGLLPQNYTSADPVWARQAGAGPVFPAYNGNPDPNCTGTTQALGGGGVFIPPSGFYCAGQGKLKNADPYCSNNPPDPTYCNGPNDPKDPEDLSFIKNFAAIGDSYAAGIGAGNRVGYFCSRYDGGYPSLMNTDERLGDPANRKFTFTACSGDETPAIIAQANSLPAGQDVITISAGGNDAKLVDVLNACVYTFYGALLSGNCDKTLQNVEDILNSQDFTVSIGKTIQAAQAKLSSGGMIYYTGYAKFFDTTTNECDKVSWHFWLNLWTRQYLTQARRTTMNNLVDLINKKISAACTAAGSNVAFVNYDDYYGRTQGRYCQPGVDEDNSANREGLLFYEMQTKDTPIPLPVWSLDDDVDADDNNNDKRSVQMSEQRSSEIERRDIEIHRVARINEVLRRQNGLTNDTGNGTVEATDPSEVINQDVLRAFHENPNAQLDPKMVPADIVPYLQSEGVDIAAAKHKRGVVNPIPDSWGRAFHPQQAGQALIADLVMYNIVRQNYMKLGLWPPQEQLTDSNSCPLPQKSPTTAQSATPAAGSPAQSVSFVSFDPLTAGTAPVTSSKRNLEKRAVGFMS